MQTRKKTYHGRWWWKYGIWWARACSRPGRKGRLERNTSLLYTFFTFQKSSASFCVWFNVSKRGPPLAMQGQFMPNVSRPQMTSLDLEVLLGPGLGLGCKVTAPNDPKP